MPEALGKFTQLPWASLLIALWAKAGRVGIARVRASAKVWQKTQTAQHLLFKYQSFSVFFVILQPLIEKSIYNRYIIKDDSQFE